MSFQFLLWVFVICEMFELFYVQKGDSVYSYIVNLSFLYKRGVLWFLCLHPSFYMVIFAVIYFNTYGILAAILIIFKVLDIAMKLILLQKIENKEPLGVFAYMVESNMRITFFMKISVSLFYVIFFYIAFNP
ncbi:MAG: hypothetical protein LBD84_06150 [Campylobacteraceae bacterium]|jgi:hypothetical protein|nr:hypothetical protein [Campylobacteraceae bacterium]